MGYFDAEIRLLETIELSIKDIVKDTVRKYDFVILDYIRNKQLFQKGEKYDGKKIKPGYSRITIKIKQKKGDPYDRVTLKDTGKFYNTMQLFLGQSYIYVTINVSYYDKLEKKYGRKIIGLQEQFLEEFAENYIIPELKKRIDDIIATN